MSQKELALRLGCTQQHVSVLLGGKANMTLGQSLQEFCYSLPDNNARYLNDSAVNGPIPASVKTSELVDGYMSFFYLEK